MEGDGGKLNVNIQSLRQERAPEPPPGTGLFLLSCSPEPESPRSTLRAQPPPLSSPIKGRPNPGGG